MKKILVAILVAIAGAFAVYYLFPEKIAGYLIDSARSKAGLTRKEVKIDDHTIVYLEGGRARPYYFYMGTPATKTTGSSLPPI